MKTVRDLLRDADPVRSEPQRSEPERDRLRQAVVAAASGVTPVSSALLRRSLALFATLALIVIGLATAGFQIWSRGGATLQAAVRLEVRLAEDRPAPGLTEARVAGSDRLVYLHQEIVVTNDDIAQSSLVPGADPSHFGISVQFNAAGAQKMRQATASHIGRPVAVLIDGVVATAPVLRSPISASALISGDYTKADAEKIVIGIGVR